MNIFRVFFLCFIFLTCFLLNSNITVASAKETRLLPVPIVRQATPYSCGAASLLALLYYWDATSEGELSLHSSLKTEPEFGTHPINMTEYVKSLGLRSELKTNVSLKEVEAAIDRGEPVIVDYQAWGSDLEKVDYSSVWDSGHYGVIVGYDRTWLYLMDPVLGTSYGKIEREDFLKRWHDYETRNGKTEYFIQSAIFISGQTKIIKFPGKIHTID